MNRGIPHSDDVILTDEVKELPRIHSRRRYNDDDGIFSGGGFGVFFFTPPPDVEKVHIW